MAVQPIQSGKMTTRTLGALVIGCLLILNGLPALAQINNTLYFMGGVPQSNRINPANSPLCGFYLGFPTLAPMHAQINSSTFAYDDIVYPHPTEDSLITPFHPLGDKQAFVDQLKPLNFVVSDLGSALFSLGFRTRAGFFSLDVTSRLDGDLFFSGDMARLIMEGAVEGRTYSFDGSAVDLSAFDEISVNWSGQILHNLQVGARAKMLFGIGNVTTQQSEMEMTYGRDVWQIESDMLFNASLPMTEFVYDQDGNIEDLVLKEELETIDLRDIPRYLFNTRNLGIGLDVGVNYRPFSELLLSASVTDIGFISWKDEVHEAALNASFDYSEFDGNPFDIPPGVSLMNHLDSLADVALDSVTSSLTVTPGGAYNTWLNTKLFIGASYQLAPFFGVGLLSRTDFLQDKVAQQFTASANLSAGRIVNFTLSYSYVNSYLKNIGAGLALNLGPFNMYVISDNALNLLFWREDTRAANVWVGMNLVFGYRDAMRNDRQDRPLVY